MKTRFLSALLVLFVVGCATQPVQPPPTDSQDITAKAKKTEKAAVSSLRILSWNTKHLGRANFDYESGALLLKDADVIALQEVNKSQSGEDALNRLAQLLQEKVGQKVCRGISEVPSGSTERYGFLWLNAKVSFVNSNGEVVKDCPVSALLVAVDKTHADKIVREPAIATFKINGTNKTVKLASIHLVPTAKRPQDEVSWLFDALAKHDGTVIVGGDFNLDSTHESVQSATKKHGFKAAFAGVKTSLKMKARQLNEAYDNFFGRNITFDSAKVLNLYEFFSVMPQGKVYKDVSDHSPVAATFSF